MFLPQKRKQIILKAKATHLVTRQLAYLGAGRIIILPNGIFQGARWRIFTGATARNKSDTKKKQWDSFPLRSK